MVNRRLVAIGGVILVAGLAVRCLLERAADLPLSSPPPERQERNAPFIKTPDAVVEKMVELAGLQASDVVYDLGCGDGRIVITAAMKSGCRGVGFDIDPERVAQARDNAKLHAVEQRVQIVEQDLFTVDLSKADVAMMYLLPWMMNKLVPQFQAMRPGCRIVSHAFWIEGVEPDEVADVAIREHNETAPIYVYRTPLRFNPAMEKGRPPR
jgi:SAM-dependent methyltransferase